MTDDSLLKQLGKLIDTKLEPIKKQLGVITAKLTTHDKRFDAHDGKFKSIDAKFESIEKKLTSHDIRFDSLEKQIKQSQEETIEVLSELIHAGYNMHEKRITNIEKHLHLPQVHG